MRIKGLLATIFIAGTIARPLPSPAPSPQFDLKSIINGLQAVASDDGGGGGGNPLEGVDLAGFFGGRGFSTLMAMNGVSGLSGILDGGVPDITALEGVMSGGLPDIGAIRKGLSGFTNGMPNMSRLSRLLGAGDGPPDVAKITSALKGFGVEVPDLSPYSGILNLVLSGDLDLVTLLGSLDPSMLAGLLGMIEQP